MNIRYKRGVLVLIVVSECIVMSWLGYRVYRHFKRIYQASRLQVVKLNKEDYIFHSDPTLQYYYEPIPDDSHVNNYAWLPKQTISSINSDGLNDLKNYSVAKPDRTFRMVAVGDSFTYGAFVNTGDTWPSQLEDYLNSTTHCPLYDHYEVINLGVQGFDLLYDKTRFIRKGLKYKPDAVLWMVLGNDFNQVFELMSQRLDQIARTEFPKDIKSEPGGPGRVMDKAVEEFQKTHDAQWWHNYYVSVLNDYFRAYNGATVFLGLSDFDRYESTLRDLVADKQHVSVYTGLEAIYDEDGNRFIDNHPNEKGYKEFAQATAHYLIAQNIIPCQSTAAGGAQ